ncbi:siderophore-interacting protein [Corynebacterium variabile]|uniref:siderophore-interacting protein n=1 Tax=Corynebacterium variabile TaxID=1727 RepID=UPI002FE2058E
MKHGLGTATTWAYRAQPGERIHIAGPSSSRSLPEGAERLLIAGDDTATPAIARFLEDLPEGARGQVFLEVAEDSRIYDLRELPNMEVTWLPRNGVSAEASTFLADAVAAADWQGGQCFAWLAGEQSVVRDLRRSLIEQRGLDKVWIDFTGYRKRERVESVEGDAAVVDADNHETAFEKFRAAANLGLGELLNRGTTTVAGLVEATGADDRALRKLLRYLEVLELVEPVGSTGPGSTASAAGDYRPEEYRLSESGVYLTHEDVLEYLLDDGLMARQELALRRLEQAVRTGRPVYEEVTGHPYTVCRLIRGSRTGHWRTRRVSRPSWPACWRPRSHWAPGQARSASSCTPGMRMCWPPSSSQHSPRRCSRCGGRRALWSRVDASCCWRTPRTSTTPKGLMSTMPRLTR